MWNYRISNDIETIRLLREQSLDEIADTIGVTQKTLKKWASGDEEISTNSLNAFYSAVFNQGIHLNKIKEQLYKEERNYGTHTILFHGAKNQIDGDLDVKKSSRNNDFGQGFYCGENLEQSSMFVSAFPNSSIYIVDFNSKKLKSKVFHVDREWILTIAFYRGRLEKYKVSPRMKRLIDSYKEYDYFIAPIADNKMFEIIDSFIGGEITDVQCQHCLSATNLGNQYVFLTKKALKQVHIVERCYLANEEKEYYLDCRNKENLISNDKVRLARIQYRDKGKYIEEILS